MAQKARIEIEQFDNGITLRWNDLDGNADPEKKVALSGSEARTIGDMLWEEILYMFDKKLTSVVEMKVEINEE